MTRLVLLHGRDLDGQVPDTLESHWLGALGAGLAAAGSPLRLHDEDADFVYYGDTLEHLVNAGRDGGTGPRPPVTTDSVSAAEAAAHDRELHHLPTDELRFLLAVVRDVLADAGVRPPAEADAAGEVGVRDLVRVALVRVLALLDGVPGLSAAVILLFFRDVYTYLHDDRARAAVDDGVTAALPADGRAVVVAHSLGGVVAYSVLARRAAGAGLEVPLLLTMGCPLGIRAVRDALAERAPLLFPPGVGRWVNVHDRRDLLAMHGLASSFPQVTDVEVDNAAPGHHSAAIEPGRAAGDEAGGETGAAWTGYLATPQVGTAVARALAPVS